MRGLSPPVRGNPRGCQGFDARVGSIPACAGEPAVRQPEPILNPVYPRLCGGTRVVQSRAR